MDKRRIYAIIIVLLFLAGSYGAYLFVNVPMDNAEIEIDNITSTAEIKKEDIKSDTALIFYSSSCPHCEIVDAYLKTDKSSLKVDVRKLKVDDPKTDKENIQIALEKIKECKLKDN